MAAQNGKSSKHFFFVNLMCMRFLANPNAAEIKLIKF